LPEEFIQSARISEEHLLMALSQVKLGFWELNYKTKLIECTTQNKINFGLELNEIISENDIIDAILPDDRWCRAEALAAAMNPVTPTYDIEIRVRRADQSIRWLQVRGTIIFDRETPVRIIGTSLDISEKKGMELLRDEILNITTHELKSPLSVVKGYLQLLSKFIRSIGNDKYQLIADRAITASEKVERLMDEAMKMQFQNQFEMILKKEHMDLEQLVREVTSNAKLISPDIKINIGTPSHLPRVFADRYRIAQVLTNLLNNAIKYTPYDTLINIELFMINSKVQVNITDNGVGISEQERDKVFQKFYRVEQTKQLAEGSGIGLFICSEIINRHQGEIGMLSNPLGKGTQVFFTLPVNE